MAFPQTPGQTVPGAFLHTPAVASRFNAQQQQDPVRRRLFPQSSSSTSNQPPWAGQGQDGSVAGLSAPTNSSEDQTLRNRQEAALAPPLPPLARAARSIDRALDQDAQYPELDAYCRQTSSDYEVADMNEPWTPFETTHTYAIPDNVFAQFDLSQVSTSMGLFAELNHAWVTIDSALYLWDYTHPNPELVGYEDNVHHINAIKLVAPKPGVFNPVISHVIVVSTVQDMFLLGVAAKDTPTGNKSVELFGTKMTLNLNRTEGHVIAATASGRIFFAGPNDSDIYELYYQQEEKWFSSRTSKINHTYPGWSAVVPKPSQLLWGKTSKEHIIEMVVDDTRNLLYSLSNFSTVRTYHIEGPDKLTRVIERTKSDFLRDIAHILSGASPLLDDRIDIVSISAISAIEDHKLHLMALTNTGCRLYMSATGASSYIQTSTRSPPQSMQLQAIRFPPTDWKTHRRTRFSQYGGPNEVTDMQSRALDRSRRGVRFAPGYFLDFVIKGEQGANDILFISAPDSGRIKAGARNRMLRFYEHATTLELNGQAEDIGLITKPFAATRQPQGFGNELAVQFDDPYGTEFAILTNTGVYVIRRKSLVDIFAAAIRISPGDEGLKAEVNKFLNAYGRVETITAALAVACRQGDSNRLGVGRTAIDQSTLDRAKLVFTLFGGNPTLLEQDAQPATVDQVKPSSRFSALTVYLSRLIRNMWKANIISVGSNAAGGLAISSPIPKAKLESVQSSIESLRRFLDTNRGLIQGLSGSEDLQRAATKQDELKIQGEHQAMKSMQILMKDISEGISFVMTLFDERVEDIFARLDETARQQLRELTYERLFSQSSGKELAKELVKAIVNRNIENGSNVDTVADALRRKCGSFCSTEDVQIFKAQEQLKKASEPSLNPNTSRTLLHQSLLHFQKVASSLTQANLESAIEQYTTLKYYAGAIQLCLTVANEKDRGNSALSWVNEGKPGDDHRAKAFDERKTCYNLIHHVLQQLDFASSREPETIDGKLTLIATKRAEAYDVVNGSTDEVFHFDLYDWYIQNAWTERLLNIESNHVVTFLKKLAGTGVEPADLLCRYYTMRSRFFDAAQVQFQVAQSNFPISVKDRLTLLSKAKTNASVMTTGVSRQQLQLLNHSITELLEVAHIQDDLLERLQADGRVPAERIPEIRDALDGIILTLSDLFNLYADQAGYYDLCLIIYHVADFRSPTTIAQTWGNLIQQTHERVAEQWAVSNAERRRRGSQVGDPPPQPYETLVSQIQDICHRSSNDSFIFPVPTLLPEICRYALENGQDGRIGADVNWTIMLFLSLGVSHDLVVRVLEQMFEAQEVPFRNSGRTRVVEWTTYAISQWLREINRHGRSESRLEPWVAELILECDNWVSSALTSGPRGSSNEGGADIRELSRNVKEVRRAVDGITASSNMGRNGSIGFF